MLNGEERDRLKVLHEVKGGHLTQKAAAGRLGMGDREVRRLLVRIAEEGDAGVVHGLRGKASNRRLPGSLRARALKLVKAKYRDFGPTLATEENLRVLWGYLERWGRPVEFYTDKHSMFSVNRPQREAEDEAWPEALTQIGRALRELGIGWIAAHSPQAKGRIERFFGTAQDRLVKGLRLAGADNLPAAQRYLEQAYLPHWNQTFTVAPAESSDAHRPLRAEHELASILSLVEERIVTSDYTIRYGGKIYQIGRGDIRPGLRGGRVRVERRLDGSLAVKFRQDVLTVTECAAQPKVPPVPKPPDAPRPRSKVVHNWMKNFHLHKSPPLEVILPDATRSGSPTFFGG